MQIMPTAYWTSGSKGQESERVRNVRVLFVMAMIKLDESCLLKAGEIKSRCSQSM